MIQIDAGWVAILITVLLAILGMAAAWGALSQKVKHHEKEIDENKCDIKEFREENRLGHEKLYNKLDEIIKSLMDRT